MRKLVILLLLFITSCSSTSLKIFPGTQNEPVEITSNFSAIWGGLEILAYLKYDQFPPVFIIENKIIKRPFPFAITGSNCNVPERINFVYPATFPVTIHTVITSFHPLKILEYSGEITTPDRKITFSILEGGNKRDGNILTGENLLTENITFLQGNINNASIQYLYSTSPEITPEMLNIVTFLQTGEKSIVTFKFYNQTITMERINMPLSIEGVTRHDIVTWDNGILKKIHTIVSGKNFRWFEDVTEETNRWYWKLNRGELGYGFFTESSLFFTVKGENLLCINYNANCKINFHIKNKNVTFSSPLISGEGKIDSLSYNSRKLSLTYRDLAGSYSGYITGISTLYTNNTFYYTRNLALTNIENDETGTGEIYTFLNFHFRWEKKWYSGKSNYILNYYYPEIQLKEIKGN